MCRGGRWWVILLKVLVLKYSLSNELNMMNFFYRVSIVHYYNVAWDDDFYIFSVKEEMITRQQSTSCWGSIRYGTGQMLVSFNRSACSIIASTTVQRSKSVTLADRDNQPTDYSVLKEQLDCLEMTWGRSLLSCNPQNRGWITTTRDSPCTPHRHEFLLAYWPCTHWYEKVEGIVVTIDIHGYLSGHRNFW